MPRWSCLVLSAMFIVCATTVQAATPTASLGNFYVSTIGWDGNDGLSAVMAFGSLTRAVQALDALDSASNTANVRVLISPGTHATKQLVLDFQRLSYVEFYGDSAAFFFPAMTAAEAIIENDATNSGDSLITMQNCACPMVLQNLTLRTDNLNSMLNMVYVDSCDPVLLYGVKLDYYMLSAGNLFESILTIHHSANVNLENIKTYFEDQTGINFGTVRNLRIVQSQDVACATGSFSAWHPTGGSIFQPAVYVTQSTNVTFKNCLVGQVNADANTYGFELAPDAADVTLDSCGISNTARGVYLDNTWNAVVQNSWMVNGGYGVYMEDARSALIVNNCIKQNWAAGVMIDGECVETQIFNNLVVNNGGLMGPQMAYTFSPLAPSGNPPPWQSGFNLFAPAGGQSVGRDAGGTPVDIPNMKEWHNRTGQDEPGVSKCLSLTFGGTPFVPDSGTVAWEGYGTMTFGTDAAPATDYDSQPRPFPGLLYADTGCFEKDDVGLMHHFSFTPDTTSATVGNTITVDVIFRDSMNQTVYAMPGENLYVYLEDPSNGTGIDATAVIQAVGYPMQVTGTAGLYYLESTVFGAALTGFQITVSRSALEGRTAPAALRMIEWGHWYDNTAVYHGGRCDDRGTQLRWTAVPQPQASLMTATSPVLASGQPQDYSLVRITMRDGSGDLISGLAPDQFVFTVAGGQYDIDFSSFQEDAFNPGTYQVTMRSTEVGTRTLTVAVSGTVLNSVTVVFQAGIYGHVFDAASDQPLSNIRVQLRRSDGGLVGEAYSDLNGEFRILDPAPVQGRYVLSIVDPEDRYVRQERVYDWAPTMVQYARIDMDDQKPAKIRAHAYPNPAKRGAVTTVVYEAPRSGRASIEVFDLRGKRIAVLLDEDVYAGQGRVVWQGQNRFGRTLAPGTYIVVMRMDDDVSTWKLVIIP